MDFGDIEVGITESPIRINEMMLELMTASTALSTAKVLSADPKVRSVLIGAWVINILCIVPFFVYAILKDSQGDLIGLGMVVVPLYISKIIESLNHMYRKINKVYSESEYIKRRLIEIFDACELRCRECPSEKINYSAGKNIVNLSRGILTDLATCEKETKVSNLIINSFMWKSPHYTKYLDRSFVNDKTGIILTMLKCSC